jgi:hypothetical protein
MASMSLVPATSPAFDAASQRCMSRAKRIVKVKFIGFPGLPAEAAPVLPVAEPEPRSSPLSLLTRVLGRLWVARP